MARHVLNYFDKMEQFTYIQHVNVFVVGSVCFTSSKQEDLLIDYSTHVVISIKETLISELRECSRRAWKWELPPRAKSRQKGLMKNRPHGFQMRSLKKMIPATNAPWQQPAHSVLSPNIPLAQNLLLWEWLNVKLKNNSAGLNMREIARKNLALCCMLTCCWGAFCTTNVYMLPGNMDILYDLMSPRSVKIHH